MTTLIIFMFVFLVIIIVGIVNEKFFHIPNDIALVLFSTVIGISLLLLSKIESFSILNKVTETYSSFDFAEFLFHGVHCFMLFAGASKLHFSKLMSNAKSVLLLSTVTTVIFAAGFGFLFWLAAKLLGITINIWVCILLGCILGPTAPLAVTGILDKLGVAKSVTADCQASATPKNASKGERHPKHFLGLKLIDKTIFCKVSLSKEWKL